MKLYARIEMVQQNDTGILTITGPVIVIGAPSVPSFGFSVELANEPSANAISQAIVAQIQSVTASYGVNVPTSDVQIIGL